MAKTRLVGDVHGNASMYRSIISEVDKSIQVGDFGVGFGHHPVLDTNHCFIRGNHDNPALSKTYPNYIEDGHHEELTTGGNIMFVGGAWSIDYAYRQENVSWWRDEEINEVKFGEIYDEYQKIKPRIMITHDCPHCVASELFQGVALHKPIHASHTSRWFDVFLTAHKPELWMFGHWHTFADKMINGTRFICLPEFGYADINF